MDPTAAGLECRKDPYIVLLPAMAVGSKPLMLASLVLSGFHDSSSEGDSRMRTYAAKLCLGTSCALTKMDNIVSDGTHWLTVTVAAVFLSLIDFETYPTALPFARRSIALLINSNVTRGA
jgi:hypothetical protein